MQLTPFALAPHVLACEVDDQVVMLDLRTDQYLAMGGITAQSLAGRVGGWPMPHVLECDSQHGAFERGLRTLHKRGYLTDRPVQRQTIAIQAPCATLDAEDDVHETRTGAARTLWFFSSMAYASFSLRCRSLQSIVRSIAPRLQRAHSSSGPIPGGALRDSVAAYLKLRPLATTTRDQCLHDSLALTHFLAGEGLRARCVVGVRTRPFGAHAWVQSEHTVLNDVHEHVGKFTPILVI